MTILTTSEVTDSSRRSSVRELSDISLNAYNDTDLDRKIENADAIMLTHYNIDNITTLDTIEQRNALTVSNMIAASLICIQAGETEDLDRADRLRTMYMDIIKARNRTNPVQSSRYVTRGNDGLGARGGTFG